MRVEVQLSSDDEAHRRMKTDLVFGMRFMHGVPSTIAYKQAFFTLAGGIGPVTTYTDDERAEIARLGLDQARRVLLGSVLDQFGLRSEVEWTTEASFQYIQQVVASLPIDKDDERVVDALVAKRTASLGTRPLR